MQQRIYWIDNLKGFILLLVCFLHLELYPSLSDYLRGGRMTTFFFLSGLLFSTRNYPTFFSYFKSKSHSLLIPYLILSYIYTFANILINKTYTSAYFEIHMDILQGYSPIIPLWFIYTLFQVSIVFYLINKISNKHFKFIALFVSLFIGWYCNIHSLVLPFHMNTMFSSLFFFLLGAYSKRHINKNNDNHHLTLKKGFMILSLLIIYTISYYMGGTVDLLPNRLGTSMPIFLIYTISGILLFISIFKFISQKDNLLFGIFRNIARNALVILTIHFPLAIIFNKAFETYSNYEYFIYVRFVFVVIGTIIAIPIFRCYLYWLIGKEKISIKESLSIH